MLYYVLHQAVLVDLQLSISFGPCSSSSALLQQEAENTMLSFIFALVQRELHLTRELQEWSRTETDCGDSREFVMWDTMQQDAAEMQNWGNQSKPTSCYRAPEQATQQVLLF